VKHWADAFDKVLINYRVKAMRAEELQEIVDVKISLFFGLLV
jgi:hypothetical protein